MWFCPLIQAELPSISKSLFPIGPMQFCPLVYSHSGIAHWESLSPYRQSYRRFPNRTCPYWFCPSEIPIAASPIGIGSRPKPLVLLLLGRRSSRRFPNRPFVCATLIEASPIESRTNHIFFFTCVGWSGAMRPSHLRSSDQS